MAQFIADFFTSKGKNQNEKDMVCGIFIKNQANEFYFGDYSKLHLLCSFFGMPFLPLFVEGMQREYGIIMSTIATIIFPPAVLCYPMDHKVHGERLSAKMIWDKFGIAFISLLLAIIFLILTAVLDDNEQKGAMLVMAMIFLIPIFCYCYWVTSDDYRIRQRKIKLGYIEPFTWDQFKANIHKILIGTSMEEEWMRTHEHYNTKDYKGHWKPKWNANKYRKKWLCEEFHLLVRGDENPKFFRVDDDVILQAAREEEHIRFGDIVSKALGGHGFERKNRKGKKVAKNSHVGRNYANPHHDAHRKRTTQMASLMHGLDHHDADSGDVVLHMKKLDITNAAHAWHLHAHQKHHDEHDKRMSLISHYNEEGVPDHLRELNKIHKAHFADHQEHYDEIHLKQYEVNESFEKKSRNKIAPIKEEPTISL